MLEDSVSKSFRDLKKKVFAKKGGMGSDLICPRDGEMGCSYTDALYAKDRELRAKATHFVSWSWGYTVEQVSGALGSWSREGDSRSKEAFLWICFFCNNQYRLKKGEVAPETLKDSFENNLKSIGQMIIILDNCLVPKYTTRMWCVFEAFVSVQQKITPTIVLPEGAIESLSTEMSAAPNPMEASVCLKSVTTEQFFPLV